MTEAEFARLVGLYRGVVFRAAYCCLGNYADAEDISQEVFLALLTYSGCFNDDEHIKAWLLRVTVNKCKDARRVFLRRPTVPLEEAAERAVLPEEDSTLELVMSLRQKLRAPLYMYYYEGYSVREIATLLNEKESTITTRLSRGRRKLKELLTKEEKYGLQ